MVSVSWTWRTAVAPWLIVSVSPPLLTAAVKPAGSTLPAAVSSVVPAPSAP